MKKHILRLIALVVFASSISSCSVEYREHHRHHDEGHEHHDGDHDNHYHN